MRSVRSLGDMPCREDMPERMHLRRQSVVISSQKRQNAAALRGRQLGWKGRFDDDREMLRAWWERTIKYFQNIAIKVKYFLKELPDLMAGLLVMTMIVGAVACVVGFFACIGCCIYECCVSPCFSDHGQGMTVGETGYENRPDSKTLKYDEKPGETDATVSGSTDDFEA